MRKNLDAMVCDLSQSLKDTNSDTATFQAQIDKDFTRLADLENQGFSLEQVIGVVRNIVKESANIRSSTVSFTQQLQKAQSEIDSLKTRLAESEKDVLYDALTNVLNRRAFDEDINAQIGYFNIGDYIGDPRLISSSAETYPELDALSKDYFDKYYSNYNL